MRSLLILIISDIIFCFPLKAQMGWQEAGHFMEYWKSNKQLSGYSDAVQRKVLYDPANQAALHACLSQVRDVNDLNLIQMVAQYNFADLGKEASQRSGIPKELIAGFDEKVYRKFQTEIGALGVDYGPPLTKLDQKGYNDLVATYSSKRKEKMTSENAFNALVASDPPNMEKLRLKISDMYKDKPKPVTNKDPMMNKLLLNWLEMQYWDKVQDDIRKKIGKSLEEAEKKMNPCDAIAASLLEEAKQAGVKTEWDGAYFNRAEQLSIKGEHGTCWKDDDLISGSDPVKLTFEQFADNVASGHWSQDITASTHRSGTFSAKLEADLLTIHFTEVTPTARKWKIEYSRRRLPGN